MSRSSEMNDQKSFSVLFVCTANICRSPMAEALLKGMLEGRPEIGPWRVESAGVSAVEGFSASENSGLAIREYGLDLSHHRSQPASGALMDEFNLILVMEDAHRQMIQRNYPHLKDRVYLLSEMVSGEADVEDPYGSVLTAYQVTADEIFQILTEGFDKLVQLATA